MDKKTFIKVIDFLMLKKRHNNGQMNMYKVNIQKGLFILIQRKLYIVI
jgi:hypothetical protein